jgi:hypothetical protein
MSLVHSVHDRTFIDARHSASRTIANLNSLFAAAAPRRRRDRAQRSLSHRRDDDAHATARSIDVDERRFTLSAIPPYSSSSVSTHSTSIWRAHYSFDSYAHTNTFTPDDTIAYCIWHSRRTGTELHSCSRSHSRDIAFRIGDTGIQSLLRITNHHHHSIRRARHADVKLQSVDSFMLNSIGDRSHRRRQRRHSRARVWLITGL